VSRAYRTLSEVCRAFSLASDEQGFLDDVCRILVQTGGYRLAWIGFAEHEDGKVVRPVAQRGCDDGYLETVENTWADTVGEQGPTGTAIRTGKPAIVRDIPNDPRFAPWREEAIHRGYASSVALPLVCGSEMLGALTVYAPEPDAFDSVEVELLSQLAAELARGIVALRGLAEQTRMASDLQQIQAKFGVLWESAADAVFLMTRDRFVDCNSATLKLYGCLRSEIVGRTPWASRPRSSRTAATRKKKLSKNSTLPCRGIRSFSNGSTAASTGPRSMRRSA
jgi:GAF domain-containing protein